jgi:glucose-1-phosphate thymidylyltransferase
MGRGYTWLDTGTHEDLIKVSAFVKVIESRQGIKIACLEEISFNNGWITAEILISRTDEK